MSVQPKLKVAKTASSSEVEAPKAKPKFKIFRVSKPKSAITSSSSKNDNFDHLIHLPEAEPGNVERIPFLEKLGFEKFTHQRLMLHKEEIDIAFWELYVSLYLNLSWQERSTKCCINLMKLVELRVYDTKKNAKRMLMAKFEASEWQIQSSPESSGFATQQPQSGAAASKRSSSQESPGFATQQPQSGGDTPKRSSSQESSDISSQQPLNEELRSEAGAAALAPKKRGFTAEVILLTPDCFRRMCMLAESEGGKKIRRYYIVLENAVHEYCAYEKAYHEAREAYFAEGKASALVALEGKQEEALLAKMEALVSAEKVAEKELVIQIKDIAIRDDASLKAEYQRRFELMEQRLEIQEQALKNQKLANEIQGRALESVSESLHTHLETLKNHVDDFWKNRVEEWLKAGRKQWRDINPAGGCPRPRRR